MIIYQSEWSYALFLSTVNAIVATGACLFTVYSKLVFITGKLVVSLLFGCVTVSGGVRVCRCPVES
jgi:hypothetical protein